jgi:hypothetical protein
MDCAPSFFPEDPGFESFFDIFNIRWNPAPTDKKPLISQDEFNEAFTSCGYDKPSANHYKYFIEFMPLGKISSKREVAMFLAQVMHESGGLKFKVEQNWQDKVHNYGRSKDYPENLYYGRGYIQLTQ